MTWMQCRRWMSRPNSLLHSHKSRRLLDSWEEGNRDKYESCRCRWHGWWWTHAPSNASASWQEHKFSNQPPILTQPMPNNANKRHLRRREQCSLSVNYSFDLTKELIFLWNLERFFAKSGTLRVFLQNEHVKRNQQKKFGQSVGISGHVLSNTLFRSKYIKNTVIFPVPTGPWATRWNKKDKSS